MNPGLDTRIDSLTEEQGGTLLQLGFDRLDRLSARGDAMEVNPSSSLAGDDAATAYDPLSNQLRSAITVATDHLHTVQLLLSNEMLPAMSTFTLVRSAFEALGNAAWLLGPTQRDDRVLRLLQLIRSTRKQLHTAVVELGRPDDGFARMEGRMIETRDARPALVGASLNAPTLTERLRLAAEFLPASSLPPLTLWRFASGIAHGNRSMLLNLLELQPIREPGPQGGEYRMTTSVAVLALLFTNALNMLEAVLDLWDRRNIGR